MIKITFLEKDDKVVKIEASGHALFAEKGKDIVCSAVSAILVGGCNALTNHQNYQIIIVMRTILIQLMTIEESYKSYISISKKM